MNPLFIWPAITFIGGALTGFVGGSGVSGLSDLIKYSVFGAGAYFVLRELGVIK
tara:strand:+ start:441 stop:602 length:162 start_codon:yes stop_codon:yes gene_type:complete